MTAYQYDLTVRVNLTLEYAEEQTPADVRADAHSLLEDFDQYRGELHAWACDVSGGKASQI